MHNTHEGGEKKFWLGYLKGRYLCGNVGIDAKAIIDCKVINCIQVAKVRFLMVGFCEHEYKLCVHKIGEFLGYLNNYSLLKRYPVI
jgi:hypothetical protein